MLRRTAYIVLLLAVPFGSFFITLWLTEPQVPNAPDNGSPSEVLAANPISRSSDLAKPSHEAGLIASQQLSGHVDTIRRIDEQKVDMIGWAADGGGTALANAPTPGRAEIQVRGDAPTPVLAEIQVSGSPESVTVEARDTSVEDSLAALSRAFDMDYQSSIELDKRLYGTYVGPLSRVVTRILQGYNFILKTDSGSILVTVVGTPASLTANPAPQRRPASGAPQAPAPVPRRSGAPAPAPVPQQSGAPAPAPVPQGLGSAITPAPVPGSSVAPVVGPTL
jgi:hypothetical protein